jgi:hypothetical protein
MNINIKQLLNEVEQNIVICQWRAISLFPMPRQRKITDSETLAKSQNRKITKPSFHWKLSTYSELSNILSTNSKMKQHK